MTKPRPLRAMVLAAGAGTRLRPLTYAVPKPMVPVLNRPVLFHVLSLLRRFGVTEVMLNLHNQPEMIKSYCGDGARWGLHLRYSYEPKLLGTAGAVKKCEAFFKDGPFLILSGDGISDIDIEQVYSFHREKRALATIVMKSVDYRFDYGVTLTDGGGRVKSFVEKPRWGDIFSDTVNTGIYLFEPEVFRHLPKGKEYDFGHELFPKLLKLKRRVFGYAHPGYWCDVGNLGEYRRAQKDGLDGNVGLHRPGREIQPKVWVEEGTSLHPSATLIGPCLIGRRCAIGAGAEIGPYTVIGDGVRVGEKARLKNCILWDGVRVGKNVLLSNCIIGEGGNVTEDIAVYEAAVLNVKR